MKAISLLLLAALALNACATNPPATPPQVTTQTCGGTVTPLAGARTPQVYVCSSPTPDPYGIPPWTYGLQPTLTGAFTSVSGPGFTTGRTQVSANLADCAKTNALAAIAAANAMLGALIANRAVWDTKPFAPEIGQLITTVRNNGGKIVTIGAAVDFLVAVVSFLGPAQVALLATAIIGGGAVVYVIVNCAAHKSGGIFA